MNYLITGGAGFIGSHLAAYLLEQGHQVHILDNLSTGDPENIRKLTRYQHFRSTVADIRDVEAVEQAIARCDQVYHLAASVGVKKVMEQGVETLTTNVLGTENVLRLAAHYRVKVFLASSSEVYGKVQGEDSLLSEADDCLIGATSKKRWGYACSKAMDEFLAKAYQEEQNLDVVIGRFFNVVGAVTSANQKNDNGKVIPRFIDQAMKGEPIRVYGDGSQLRSFTHVTDVIQAVTALMNVPEAVGEVFNVGSENEVSIRDLAEKVKQITGSSSQIQTIPFEQIYGSGFEDIGRRSPDLTKIKSTIPYKPQFDMDQILQEAVNEYLRDKGSTKAAG